MAHEVQIEPQLQPLTGESLQRHANTESEARLDVAARGFWQEHEMAIFDIRVFNPFAKSYLNQNQSLELCASKAFLSADQIASGMRQGSAFSLEKN